MSLSFSGTPSVNASVTYGAMSLPAISGSTNDSSVRTRIREALAYGLKNTISKTNGYFFDVGEVNVNAVANNAKRRSYPSIDIIWTRERYTNSISGGNSLGGFNKIASIRLACYLFEENCKATPEDIVRMRENMVADIEKYLGINFTIPNSVGVETAFNSIPVTNIDHGIEATEPYGSEEINIEIYYRIEQADPTQDF